MDFDIAHWGAFLIFGVPPITVLLIVWVVVSNKRKTTQTIAHLYFKAIEKGEKMPDDFLEFPFKRKTNNPLKTAIILIAVGVGVSLFMFLRADCGERLQAVALGIIPFVIGVGYLTYYLISRKQAPAKDE